MDFEYCSVVEVVLLDVLLLHCLAFARCKPVMWVGFRLYCVDTYDQHSS